MSEQLKPCPSCGSGDIAWCSISHRPYCRECNFWGSVNFGTDEEAIVAWNRRTEPTPDSQGVDFVVSSPKTLTGVWMTGVWMGDGRTVPLPKMELVPGVQYRIRVEEVTPESQPEPTQEPVGYSAHTWLRIEEGEVPVMGRATLHAAPNPSRVPLYATPVEDACISEMLMEAIEEHLNPQNWNNPEAGITRVEACLAAVSRQEDTRTVAEIRQAVEEVRPPRMYTTGTEWLADLMSERASACAAILAHLGLEEKI